MVFNVVKMPKSVGRLLHFAFIQYELQWRINGRDDVSYHRDINSLLNRLFRHKWKKDQSSASLAFVRGFHRWPVNSPLKDPVTRKMFPFGDVIMLLPLPFTGAVMASWVVLWPLYLLYEVMRQSPVDEEDIQKDIVVAGWYRLYKRLSSNESRWQSLAGDMLSIPCIENGSSSRWRLSSLCVLWRLLVWQSSMSAVARTSWWHHLFSMLRSNSNVHGSRLLPCETMLKPMLINKDFLTWLLNGWRLCRQPIRCEVWKTFVIQHGF